MTRDSIKYIAIFTMLFNHIANVLLTPDTILYEVLVDIGYFTAITMCYFLVEGFYYTHSRKKYGQRLLIFAAISQIPYTLAIGFEQMNMIFTLFLCFMILVIQENMRTNVWRIPLIVGLLLVSIYSDWAILAPVFTIWFQNARGDHKKVMHAYGIGAALFVFFNYTSYVETLPPVQALIHALLSAVGILVSGIVILCFYNGKKSGHAGKFSKWFFYIFYPAHLLILGVIRLVIM